MKVYLVDDDSEEAELFRDAAARVHDRVEVIWYDNVMDAFDALTGQEKQPDFVFLDLNIPQVTGKDLLKMLRENTVTAHVPVVIYSTSISRRDIEETSLYNVRSYLQKPEDFTSLCSKLAELLGNGHGV